MCPCSSLLSVGPLVGLLFVILFLTASHCLHHLSSLFYSCIHSLLSSLIHFLGEWSKLLKKQTVCLLCFYVHVFRSMIGLVWWFLRGVNSVICVFILTVSSWLDGSHDCMSHSLTRFPSRVAQFKLNYFVLLSFAGVISGTDSKYFLHIFLLWKKILWLSSLMSGTTNIVQSNLNYRKNSIYFETSTI